MMLFMMFWEFIWLSHVDSYGYLCMEILLEIMLRM